MAPLWSRRCAGTSRPELCLEAQFPSAKNGFRKLGQVLTYFLPAASEKCTRSSARGLQGFKAVMGSPKNIQKPKKGPPTVPAFSQPCPAQRTLCVWKIGVPSCGSYCTGILLLFGDLYWGGPPTIANPQYLEIWPRRHHRSDGDGKSWKGRHLSMEVLGESRALATKLLGGFMTSGA